MTLKFLDVFAGASGLSEGFVQAGFKAVAHVEMDQAACYTIKTRLAYHWLASQNKIKTYDAYLNDEISREELYSKIPKKIINTVLNDEISEETLPHIFSKIDQCLLNDKLDLIIGGPPCQAYSLVGRSRDSNGMKADKRNYLYLHYAKFLEKYKPRYFVFENVLGLLSAKDDSGELYFNKMLNLFKQNGYTTKHKVMNASNYGVPQSRKRVILIGKLNSESDFDPFPEKNKQKTSSSDVLSDLPKLNSGKGSIKPQELKPISKDSFLIKSGIRDIEAKKITWHLTRPHAERDLEIYKIATNLWNISNKRLKYDNLPRHLKTHKNESSFLDRFKVVALQQPSHTVVAHISKDGHYYIHPDSNQNRSLSVREAARLQTFPDTFHFESVTSKPSRTAAFKQIGNAVPVLLAKSIAFKLKEIITT